MNILQRGSKGQAVKLLQINLTNIGYFCIVDGEFGPLTKYALMAFQKVNGLVGDGVYGPISDSKLKEFTDVQDIHQPIKDIITRVATEEGVEPELMLAVAECESGFNPKSSLYNVPSKSIDRGLYQWNNKYHQEIPDNIAYDPEESCRLACRAVKNGKLHAYWSASEHCWKKKVSLAILIKYGVVRSN